MIYHKQESAVTINIRTRHQRNSLNKMIYRHKKCIKTWKVNKIILKALNKFIPEIRIDMKIQEIKLYKRC